MYVELHVLDGRVEELEVYNATGGDGAAIALAEITTLGEVTVS